MNYDYSAENYLSDPPSYMYTPFGGRDFMLAWQTQRQQFLTANADRCSTADYLSDILKRLSNFSPDQARFKQILNDLNQQSIESDSLAAEPDTEKLLTALAKQPQASFTDKYQPLLKGFVRRFEISKKIPSTMELPLMPLKGKALLTIPAYALLAMVLSFRISQAPSTRELNCLLKLNDLITSQDPAGSSMLNMTPRHYSAAAIAIMGEMTAIALLCQELADDSL